MQNLRLALRLFRLRPGFSLAIVMTLAIGLGAATAIFSLVYALLLRPLPFATPDQLIVIDAVVSGETGRLALREYRDLARDSRTIDMYAAYYRSQYNVADGGVPETLSCTITSSTLFTALGITPVQGGIWSRAEDFTRQHAVVISHRLWRQRFAARADIAGQTIVMDGAPYRVVGVMPEGADYPLQTDVFRAVTDYNAPHVRAYSVLARLRPGATLREAQAELDAFASRFAAMYPDTNRGVQLRATMLRDAYVGRARPFVLLLLGAVALLLLIACANVGNLLLSRAVGRRGDVAVRLALGATRRQLIGQSLAESLVLAGAGAVAGVLAAHVSVPALMALVQRDLPPWLEVRIDAVVLTFAVVVTLAMALAIGITPAWQASAVDVERALRQNSGRTAGSRRQYRSRRWLVAAQTALAALLLIAAGVLVSGLRELVSRDPGFRVESVMTFRVDPPYSRYADVQTTAEFYRRAEERIGRIPGVTAVGANNRLPFSALDLASPRVSIEGRSQGRADEEPFVNLQLVDGGYFNAMGIRLRAGRLLDERDSVSATQSTPLVAVISERTARRFWGEDSPLGKRLRLTWNNNGVSRAGGTDLWLTVVGIVSNVRFQGLDDESGLDVYAAHRQLFAGDSYIVVRSASAPQTLGPQLAAAVRDVDPEQAIFDLRVMQARVNASIWQQRLASAVLMLFAGIALALASFGTYAVTAHAVVAQRRDLAVRLALGSSASRITTMVLRQWGVPVLLGTLAGTVLGLAFARALSGVFDMPAHGLLPSLALPIVLIAAAALACIVPVVRVTRRLTLTDVLRAQ
jgi:putative ABC transport system permease protein